MDFIITKMEKIIMKQWLHKRRVEEAYKDEKRWAKMALLNTACSGKFTSDRTIQEYVDDIWHLDKVVVKEN